MKLLLKPDCIKVELGPGEALPADAEFLSPYHFNRKRDTFYFSLRKMPEVLTVFGKTVDNLPDVVRKTYDKVIQQKRDLNALLTYGAQQNPIVNEHLTLMPHQQLAREIASVYDRFAFYYDTRTGKTPTSLAIIHDDLKEHPDHKWLVVAPLILLELAWEADCKKFIPDVTTVVCHANTKAKRIEKIQQDASIYIINTESFVNYTEYFDGFEGVILDESSSMKNNSSKFSKGFVAFSRTVKRCYLLSGTPAPNGAHEYYRQLQAIDYYGIHQSFAQFKQKYFLNLARDVRWEDLVLRPDMADELKSLIAQYALYVDKEDVLDTPGRTFIEHEFALPPELKVHYNDMRKKLAIEINDDKDVLAPTAATKMNKLNQITSGFIIDSRAVHENYYGKNEPGYERQEEWYSLSTYRITELRKLLETIGDHQVIIWANYHLEFDQIKALLGNKCVTVYGETSAKGKVAAINCFKEGSVQYLVANPASADKGLTLTNCHICIYYSMNYSYELFKQSMDRIYGDRSIQPYECEYHIMMAKGTIDSVLYKEVLLGKQTLSYAVLDHLKAVSYD